MLAATEAIDQVAVEVLPFVFTITAVRVLPAQPLEVWSMFEILICSTLKAEPVE